MPAIIPSARPSRFAIFAGNTITVNSVDPSGNSSRTTVSVTDTTKYTQDGGGALQATAITVQQADNGQCAEPGGGLHRR